MTAMYPQTEYDELLPAHARVRGQLRSMLVGLSVGDKIMPERELAQKLAVSRPTVRRAINGLCRDGVLEARQGSGTFLRRPVRPAGTTHHDEADGRHINVLMPTMQSPKIAAIVDGIEQELRRLNYRMLLSNDGGDPELQLEQLTDPRNARASGMILYPDAYNVARPEFVQAINRLIDQGVSLVLLDRSIYETHASSVVADNERGMYELVSHLLGQGYRRPALISWGPEAGFADVERMEGFRRAMSERGLSPEPIRLATLGQHRSADDPAASVVNQWLTEAGDHDLPFDSIVCFMDNMALGAFRALKAAGLSVPRDLALVGYDDHFPEIYQAAGLHLTTVQQPSSDMGRVAAQALVRHLTASPDTAHNPPREWRLNCQLIVRTSCDRSLCSN